MKKVILCFLAVLCLICPIVNIFAAPALPEAGVDDAKFHIVAENCLQASRLAGTALGSDPIFYFFYEAASENIDFLIYYSIFEGGSAAEYEAFFPEGILQADVPAALISAALTKSFPDLSLDISASKLYNPDDTYRLLKPEYTAGLDIQISDMAARDNTLQFRSLQTDSDLAPVLAFTLSTGGRLLSVSPPVSAVSLYGNLPAKRSYKIGETAKFDDGRIKVSYEDKAYTATVCKIRSFMINDFDSSTAGEKLVYIKLQGKFTSFGYTVTASENPPSSTPDEPSAPSDSSGDTSSDITSSGEDPDTSSVTPPQTINPTKDSNNFLSVLKVDEGELSPAFDPQISYYSVNVKYSTTAITITAACESEKAVFSVDNPELKPGKITEYTLLVTAENGDVRKYVIAANRADETGKFAKVRPALPPVLKGIIVAGIACALSVIGFFAFYLMRIKFKMFL